MTTYTIYVENLKCGGCANTIKKTISKIDGVQRVEIDNEESRIDLEVSNADFQIDSIKQKLKSIGYPEMGAANNTFTAAKSYVSCAIGRMGTKA